MKARVSMANDDQWVCTKGILENLGSSYKDQTKAFGTYNNFNGEFKFPWVNTFYQSRLLVVSYNYSVRLFKARTILGKKWQHHRKG